MAKLIALKEIPANARSVERFARARYADRSAALGAARYRIIVAPGCHSRPYFAPPVIGWVCSESAAIALASRVTRMPDRTAHRRTAYDVP